MTGAYLAAVSLGLASLAVGCGQEPPSSAVELPIPRPDSARTSEAGNAQGPPASDAFVAARVKAELLKESEGRAIEIEVESRDGRVRLSGRAPSRSDIERAVQVASGVDGVRTVTQQLAVKSR